MRQASWSIQKWKLTQNGLLLCDLETQLPDLFFYILPPTTNVGGGGTDQENLNVVLYLLIFFCNCIFQATLAKRIINFQENLPPNQPYKKVKFHDFANFHFMLSLPYDHFQNTYGLLVFTDFLVTTQQVCKHPTYL